MKPKEPGRYWNVVTADSPHLVAACARKNRYDTERKARRVGQSRLGQPDAIVDRLWAYPCACCRGWHLTRMEGRGVAITATEAWEGVPG